MPEDPHDTFPVFDRFSPDDNFSVIGGGELGGKAKGLAWMKGLLAEACPPGRFPDVTVDIPQLTVLGTDVFAQFMEQNELWDVALSGEPDERIGHAFQQGELPTLILGDLRALMTRTQAPLAIRSSSRLEDALHHPFAGTYATKMIPNNQADVGTRFRRLTEAIKFVYASTFFRDARQYMQAIRQDSRDERMGVIIQEVVGRRHDERFYPTLSGVLRTHSFYPVGPARPADGVASLALGLGKTIVDGGITWTYCPRFPRHAPPVSSARDLLKNTQTRFWAVNMRPLVTYNPVNEVECLVEASLEEAEYDGTLKYIASTYDADSDRIVLGTGRGGPRALNFAPILDLEEVPLNRLLEHLGQYCREALHADVEIEFAATLDPKHGTPARFGFLQIRPILVGTASVDVPDELLRSRLALLASEQVLGNGTRENLRDIVYVRPGAFEARHTPAIAAQVAEFNRALAAAGEEYVLFGFGRWGSSDPWLGISVTWPQISGARVIVEATRPEMDVDASQGSHFFHNMTSFAVQYFTVRYNGDYAIDWDWLERQPVVRETEFLRQVRTAAPLQVRVDGRTGRGVILRNE